MENNKNKKSVKFQGDMLHFCDFIQVFVFTRNHHLKTPMIFSPIYFDTIQLSRESQILHARIRLECSSLNHHLFQKNLISSSLCTCGLPETSHFLLFCTNVDLLRQRYLSVLPHRLSLSLLLNGDPNEQDVVNSIIFKHVQLYIMATKRLA